jgi:CBS domain containing-hemolysin-like protein
VLEISIVFLLLLISGSFSGTEVAFTSLSVDQLERFRRRHGARGKLTAKLHDELDVVLTTITIGNNLANLAASALVSALTIRLFGETWLTVSTIVLTILVLVIGEVTPKQIGILHNEFVTLHMSRFLRAFSIVFAPVIWLIRLVSNALIRLTGGGSRQTLTREGLQHLVRYAGSTGLLDQLDTSIVKNVFRATGVRVGAIMTHRTKIFSMEKRERAADALPALLESGYSRVPVYDEDPERIVGVALLKDVAKAVTEKQAEVPLSRLMMQPMYVPETRTFQEVLTKLRREHLNMAIVLDEYGGVSGLVTMEDLVEEFLGELYDEGEIEETQKVMAVDEGEYTILGDAPIYVVNDHLDTEFPSEGDAQTIGGYITERMGRIPDAGEHFETSEGVFTIEVVSHSRVVRVLFHRAEKNSDE